MSAVTLTLRYANASQITESAGRHRLALVSAGPDAAQDTREFLDASALHPHMTSRGLRAVSDIVGARFYVPPAMLARILREADPVATVSPGAVRFEGFSACCSAYARFDIDCDALDVRHRQNGTTNVDFGPEVRAALAQVSPDTALGLSIGSQGVEVQRDDARLVEKKVPLPLRWIKGFGEVQIAMAGMQPAFGMGKAGAQRLLRQLPRSKSDHVQWVNATGGLPRLSLRETSGAVPLRGAHRLRVFEPLMALSSGLEVHLNPKSGATAWTLDLGTQRLCLVLNKDPWRGFSGDGGLLSKLAHSDGAATAAVKAQLNWQDCIEPLALQHATGLAPGAVDDAMTELAAAGCLGYDLRRGGYFHRVLPFDLDRALARNPRLAAATALVDKQAVRWTGAGAEVTTRDVTHKVRIDDDGWHCTCPWHARNGNTRGPCKHVLAAELTAENAR